MFIGTIVIIEKPINRREKSSEILKIKPAEENKKIIIIQSIKILMDPFLSVCFPSRLTNRI
tara:strand:+ start:31 stop:213 length:183 start_codon:yes stop_codon:yes gene_type:complete